MARTKSLAKKRSSQDPNRAPRLLSKLMHSHPALGPEKAEKKKQKKKSKPQKKTTKMKGSADARVLNTIRDLQKSTKLLIPKTNFSRVVREVMQEFAGRDLRVTSECLSALHESAECFMVQFFEDAYLLTSHAKRVTLYVQDMSMLRRLRGRRDPCN